MTKYLLNLILAILIIYSLVLIYIYIFQRNLLYHPKENNYLDNQIDFEYKEIFIPVNENIKLKSWIIEKDFKKNKTLIFFHGNAGNLNNRIYKINELYNLDINILLVSWRGFSGNKGKPTEKGLYEDARSTIRWIKDQGVNLEDIILYGESLGTGIATHIAQNKNFAGLILETPFTSMVQAARNFYPYIPVGLILKDKYKNDEKIKNINIPVLVMHGEVDQIVPFWMGKKMYKLANEPKYSYFSKYDDHMMEYNEKLLNKLKKFIYSLN